MRAGKMTLDGLVTHEFPLDRGQRGDRHRAARRSRTRPAEDGLNAVADETREPQYQAHVALQGCAGLSTPRSARERRVARRPEAPGHRAGALQVRRQDAQRQEARPRGRLRRRLGEPRRPPGSRDRWSASTSIRYSSRTRAPAWRRRGSSKCRVHDMLEGPVDGAVRRGVRAGCARAHSGARRGPLHREHRRIARRRRASRSSVCRRSNRSRTRRR